MYNAFMRKAWYITGYTLRGEVLCRQCVSETLDDDAFLDPYTPDEHDDFTPIFSSDMNDELECDYCWNPLD